MKLKMLKSTYWETTRLKAGDFANVDNVTGARWIKNKLAVDVSSKAKGAPPAENK